MRAAQQQAEGLATRHARLPYICAIPGWMAVLVRPVPASSRRILPRWTATLTLIRHPHRRHPGVKPNVLRVSQPSAAFQW